LVTTQNFFDVKSSLHAKAIGFNSAASDFLTKTKKFIGAKSKLIAEAFASTKTALKLSLTNHKFFQIRGTANGKAFTFNKTASKPLVTVQRLVPEKNTVNQKNFALNTATSQLLMNTKRLFVAKSKWNVKDFIPDINRKNILMAVAIVGSISIGFLLMYKPKNTGISTSPIQYAVANTTTLPTENASKKAGNTKNVKKLLTPKQMNALINDTAGIIHFENMAGANNVLVTDPPIKTPAKNHTVNTTPDQRVQTQSSISSSKPGSVKIKYIVTDTTYFHDKPDERTARKAYLDPLRKAVLTPLKDENGYIYIVYTNRFNITSKGWINKGSLRQVP
jgi:hypothetical protein